MTLLLPENVVSVIRGASKTLRLVVRDKDKEPVNLTGSTIYFTVKFNTTDEYHLIQKISSDNTQIEIPNPTDGTAQIFLVPGDTAGLKPDRYVYDVWVILSGGERHPVVKPSVFEVKPGVTLLLS